VVVGAEYAIQVLKKILGKFPKTSLSSKDFPLDEIMNLISERMTEATGSAILNQLDVKLSSRMSEATGTSILGQLDIKISELRDSLRGADARTLTDIYDKLENIFGTVVIQSGTASVGNFPSWFTSSTRTTDDIYDKLSSISGTVVSSGTITVDNIEKGTVSVSNFPSEYPLPADQVSDLKKVSIESGTVNVANIERTVSGTVTVDNILGTVSSSVAGTVSVDNFPSEYPLPSTQVSDLKKVTVESGTVTVDTIVGTISAKVYGYDGTNWQPIKVTSDGKVVAVLG